ncbi:hypothetical protein ACIQI7_23635 [Kitasatospora sp. NPDC092039]|uniref:hypothetical protein n=1 Tax=Kitasatospora sp. NPDC092039 TaxID=3364086 RepID=UPI003818706A
MPEITFKRLGPTTYEVTHDGASYLLLKHPGGADDKGRIGRMAWYLHPWPPAPGVLEPAIAHLGTHLDHAQRLALPVLEGWTWYSGTPSTPDGEIWRHADGTTRPLTDLLAGVHRTGHAED